MSTSLFHFMFCLQRLASLLYRASEHGIVDPAKIQWIFKVTQEDVKAFERVHTQGNTKNVLLSYNYLSLIYFAIHYIK